MSSDVVHTLQPTLDPVQEARIQAMHRGFLYQHLYAVGCLFEAAAAGLTAVVVERDEDVEIVCPAHRVYVQVKTRAQAITPSDVESALSRFARIRSEHAEGRRPGEAHFVIVANQHPSPVLAASIARKMLGKDVVVFHPDQPVDVPLAWLPPAWRDIDEAVRWCVAKASGVPHAMLAPESLVWKLAGLVMSAATGQLPSGQGFVAEALPQLFEQLLVQLQDFPAPLPFYRPQMDEPALDGAARVRLICGFSGSGKTSWASQAAAHSRHDCIYFDAGDTPGTAFASSLVRELAAAFLETARDVLRRVLLPGASGIDSLRSLDTYFAAQGLSPVVVVDNVHHLPAESVQRAIGATSNLRFVLLCQPSGSTREVEALLAISRETLSGWDLDTLASATVALGAYGGAATMGRLSEQTAGMPLFVQSAARLAVRDYGGDVARLCAALDSLTTIAETTQDVILARTFDGLPSPAQAVVAVLSLVDVILDLDEINKFLSAAMCLDNAGIASIVRALRPLGVVEVFGGQRLKIHDALRMLGLRHLGLLPSEQVLRARRSLRDLLFTSLTEERSASRFSLYVRTLVELKEIEAIIEFAGDELFHEMGIADVFLSSLEAASVSADVDPEQRFWALDGLVFAKLKSGDLESVERWLVRMDEILVAYSLPAAAQLALGMKRMLLRAQHRDVMGVRQGIAGLARVLPDSPVHQRIFRYNAAVALWRVGEREQAERLIDKVIPGYCEILGISISWLVGRSLADLRPLLDREGAIDDVKHLADAMEMRSILMKSRGADPGLWRMFAMKFYSLLGAVDSAVRVGQDVADDFVARHDFIGARQIIEQHVLRFAEHHRLLDRIVAIRSQYAVVLAYCQDFSGAESEMERLQAYAGGFSRQQREEIDSQRALIADLRAGKGPRQRVIGEPLRVPRAAPLIRRDVPKVGRNEPCPCGSGLKFKKCHG